MDIWGAIILSTTVYDFYFLFLCLYFVILYNEYAVLRMRKLKVEKCYSLIPSDMWYGHFETFIWLHMKLEFHIQLFSWFLFIPNQKIQIHNLCCQKWQPVFGNWVRDFSMLDWTRTHKSRSHFFRFVLPPDTKWMKSQTQILQGRMFHLRRVCLTEGSTTQGCAWKTRWAILVVRVIDKNPLARVSWQLMDRSQECHMLFNACDILTRTNFPTFYIIFKYPPRHSHIWKTYL